MRRRCCRCQKMTENWQRVNGSPYHCYDGCFSTLGVDYRSADGLPIWWTAQQKKKHVAAEKAAEKAAKKAAEKVAKEKIKPVTKKTIRTVKPKYDRFGEPVSAYDLSQVGGLKHNA